jgi:hypothetical protein
MESAKALISFQVSGVRCQKRLKEIKVFWNLGIEELTERTKAIFDYPIIVSLIPKFAISKLFTRKPET